ncbi:hypothetical protein H4R35_001983 [Dimargaris xerosporica]|nr:hypothetical protein H4R35_001983 [Dimargaris xerosporica]
MRATVVLDQSVTQPPQATLVLVHGFGEHCRRYDHVSRALAAQGIEVQTYDQRGFGRTGRKSGQLGHTQGIDQLHLDLTAISDRVRRPDIPHFLFGHSMGGMIVLSYAARHQGTAKLTGIIASGPAILLPPNVHEHPIIERTGIFLSKWLKSFTLKTRIQLEDLCKDPRVIETAREDYYFYNIGSLQCLGDMLTVGPKLIQSGAQSFACPLLLLHGSADVTTDPKGSRDFFAKLPDALDKEYVEYDGALHELHNEPIKDEVVDKYIAWIHSRASGQKP